MNYNIENNKLADNMKISQFNLLNSTPRDKKNNFSLNLNSDMNNNVIKFESNNLQIFNNFNNYNNFNPKKTKRFEINSIQLGSTLEKGFSNENEKDYTRDDREDVLQISENLSENFNVVDNSILDISAPMLNMVKDNSDLDLDKLANYPRKEQRKLK